MLRCLRAVVAPSGSAVAAALVTAAVGALLLAPRAAGATDWHVGPIGTTMNRDCTSARAGAPLESINTAVFCIDTMGADGDAIVLQDGDHYGYAPLSTTPAHAGITIRAQTPRAARVVQPATSGSGGTNPPLIFLRDVHRWSVRDLVFAPPETTPPEMGLPRFDVLVATSEQITVQGNLFQRGLGVVAFNNVNNLSVLDNRFEPAWGAAIAIGPGVDASTPPCMGGQIERNTIARVVPADLGMFSIHSAVGIALSEATGYNLFNNAVLGVPGAGIYIQPPAMFDGTVGHVLHNTVVVQPDPAVRAESVVPLVAYNTGLASLRNNIFLGAPMGCTYVMSSDTLTRIGPSDNNLFGSDTNPACFAYVAGIGGMPDRQYTLMDYQATRALREMGTRPVARATTVDPLTALLRPGSPAINAGGVIPGITQDFLRNPRWDGMPDIGCHEINGASMPRPDGGVLDGGGNGDAGSNADGGTALPDGGEGGAPGGDSGIPVEPDSDVPQLPGLHFRGSGCACATRAPTRVASADEPAGGVRRDATAACWLAAGAVTVAARRRARRRRPGAVR